MVSDDPQWMEKLCTPEEAREWEHALQPEQRVARPPIPSDEHPNSPAQPVVPQRTRRSPSLTVVTDSEVATWNSCPQKHHFQYRERLRPLLEAKALAVGSMFHLGMREGIRVGWSEGWRSRANTKRLADEIEMSTKVIDEAVMKWASKRVTHEADLNFDELEKEVVATAGMVKWMLAHYFESSTGDLANLVLVETEKNFLVDLHNKRGAVAPYLKYAGVRDAVFFDPAYNQIVLAEHKTCGGRPQDIEKRVEMDTQTAGYLYALKQERPGLVTVDGTSLAGAHLGRVFYNVLRKSHPHSPKVNKNGEVSVAACVTTPELYLTALKEQTDVRKIPVSQKQAEFFEVVKNQGDPFFARVEYHRTKEEIERWRSDTFVNAARIRAAERDEAQRTRNTGHCNMAWSLPCTYRSVCLDPKATELRAAFRVSDDPHAEVRAAATGIDEP